MRRTHILTPSAGRTTHQDGDALKNLALKKRSIQSRKLWGEAAWEVGDTHSVYVSASYFTIGQAGGPESSVSSDLEHIAGVTSGLH
ncbi:hypothetical protein, partial [Citrobacter sp.]|uniref:hypothetical protein n=1 Tax=Citrobacter sp. TaxID=1896336 RepID=UPI002904699F